MKSTTLIQCNNCGLILTQEENECPGCGEELQVAPAASSEVQVAVTRARKLLADGKLSDAENIAINTSRRYPATSDSLTLLADICTLKGETGPATAYREQAESLRRAEELPTIDHSVRGATLHMTAASWGILAVIAFVIFSAAATFFLYQAGPNAGGRAGIIHIVPPEPAPPMVVPKVTIKEPVVPTATAAVAPPVQLAPVVEQQPVVEPVAPVPENTGSVTTSIPLPDTASATVTGVTTTP